MPWKECHVMDERLRFVARLLEGEKMAPLCAEFGISRKTGYKIFDRYKDCGVQAFSDRSHRAHRQANRLPAPIEATIVRLKREYLAGAPRRFARSSGGSSPARTYRPSAPSTRCSIATTWCSIDAGGGRERRAPSSPARRNRMRSGVPTTRASFCSAIASTAIPLRSPTSPVATYSRARRCSPRRRNSRLRSSNGPSKSLDSRWAFGPITACPLRPRMPSTG